MIEYVEKYDSTYGPVPHKFEAGTQNVCGAHGLKLAIDYISSIGIEQIANHEHMLLQYGIDRLNELSFIDIIGTKDISQKGGVLSFNVKDVHSHDVSSILDNYGVAIRSGHHCAKPLMHYLGLNSACRVSFYLYNDKQDIDELVNGLRKVRRWLGYGSK